MAKQSGLGDQMFISGVDIGADIYTINSLSTPRSTLAGTGITQSGQARLFGLRDASGEFGTFFNKAAGETFQTLKTLPATDVHLMYLRGQGRGLAAVGLVGKEVDYNGQRGDDGAFTLTLNVTSSAFGADWCQQLSNGKQTDASAANSTGIDTTASAAFGFQAYLQVFSLGSGTPTVKIQDSADNATFADLTDGSFGVVTAPSVSRIQSSSDTATVRRYLRVATTGTFTNLVFAVVINKNQGLRAI